MSERAERLQDAIGLVADGYVEEAHGDAEVSAATGSAELAASAESAESAGAVGIAGTAGTTGTAGTADVTDAAAAAGTAPFRSQARRGFGRAARRALAIAACLIVALGVGFSAFGVFFQPTFGSRAHTDLMATGAAVEETAEVSSSESELKDMMTDSVADEIGLGRSDSLAEIAADGDVGSSLTMGGSLVQGEPDFDEDDEGAAFVLTAAEWNDNENWSFFTNLVNAGTIGFPSFGIDPRHRVKVTLADGSGVPVRGESVVLRDSSGGELWHATSGKDGTAYLFYRDGEVPASVVAVGVEQALSGGAGSGGADGQQGSPVMHPLDDVTLTLASASPAVPSELQVMFIIDTTGSMSDEIAYLQKDFASIAADVGSDGVSYSVNFYRDEGEDEEYVTKCNAFTGDIAEVQRLLNAEYADGGGDEPEAVAQILAETITGNGQWRDDAAKIAFLVFDAPPHAGTDETIDAAVRSAAERGIRVVPVVSSNASRDTELFGRALAICTMGTYVFLTDDSGVGDAHLEPIVGDYTVELLHDVIVRLIQNAR